MKPGLILALFALVLSAAATDVMGGSKPYNLTSQAGLRSFQSESQIATAGEDDRNACALASKDVLRSCRLDARGDLSLAQAKCDNVSVPEERRSCRQTALAHAQSALRLCDRTFFARQGACQKLGGQAYDPAIDPANFVDRIDNPYFPLTPGTTYIYDSPSEHIEFEVTRRTKVIMGVTCVEVHDRAFSNGELVEDTRDWFAQDRDGNVWYFGENTNQLTGGLVVGVEGSFEAGVDGAKPGIIMEAIPHIGDFYRQEFSLTVAEDFAEVLSLDKSVKVPAGTFHHCLETADTAITKLDLLEHKFYAPGVGNVLVVDTTTGERTELTRITYK
jgi:hypothetical protein